MFTPSNMAQNYAEINGLLDNYSSVVFNIMAFITIDVGLVSVKIEKKCGSTVSG